MISNYLVANFRCTPLHRFLRVLSVTLLAELPALSSLWIKKSSSDFKKKILEGYNENLLQDNLKLFQHNIYSFFRLGWLQISNNDCFQIFCRIFNPFSWALLSCSLSFSNFLIITTKSTSFCRNSKYAESTLNIFDYQQNFS